MSPLQGPWLSPKGPGLGQAAPSTEANTPKCPAKTGPGSGLLNTPKGCAGSQVLGTRKKVGSPSFSVRHCPPVCSFSESPPPYPPSPWACPLAPFPCHHLHAHCPHGPARQLLFRVTTCTPTVPMGALVQLVAPTPNLPAQCSLPAFAPAVPSFQNALPVPQTPLHKGSPNSYPTPPAPAQTSPP